MYDEIYLLKKKIKLIKDKGWIPCDYKNYGSVGLMLEKLLHKNPDNFELPDYNGIELKTKKSFFNTKITLFSAAPDSFLFETRRLHKLYSYPDYKNPKNKVLNKTLKQSELTYIYNNIYFSLKVNRKQQKVDLIICDNNMNIIDKYTSWSFSMLKEKIERKLNWLCYINVDSFYSNSQLYIKFNKDRYFKLKSFERFLFLLEKGLISVTFRIGIYQKGKRKGQIHDHGTSFSIEEKDLNLLFYELL